MLVEPLRPLTAQELGEWPDVGDLAGRLEVLLYPSVPINDEIKKLLPTALSDALRHLEYDGVGQNYLTTWYRLSKEAADPWVRQTMFDILDLEALHYPAGKNFEWLLENNELHQYSHPEARAKLFDGIITFCHQQATVEHEKDPKVREWAFKRGLTTCRVAMDRRQGIRPQLAREDILRYYHGFAGILAAEPNPNTQAEEIVAWGLIIRDSEMMDDHEWEFNFMSAWKGQVEQFLQTQPLEQILGLISSMVFEYPDCQKDCQAWLSRMVIECKAKVASGEVTQDNADILMRDYLQIWMNNLFSDNANPLAVTLYETAFGFLLDHFTLAKA